MSKNILITPSPNDSNPKIDFTGASTGSIYLEVLENGSVAFQGDNGTLFSIVDDVSGSLFSIGDQSGLPIFEVFSTNEVDINGVLSVDGSLILESIANNSGPKLLYYDSASGIVTYDDPSTGWSSGGSWGQITGSISDQTDLSTALDGKLSNTTDTFTGTLTLDGSLLVQEILPFSAGATIGASDNKFSAIYVDEAYISNNSLYINNKKVLSDESDTITVSTTANQDLLVKTTGTGDSKVTSDNGILLEVSSQNTSKDIEIKTSSNTGSVILESLGSGGLIQLLSKGTTTLTANTITLDASNAITANKPFRYSPAQTLTDDNDIVYKGYVDGAFLKRTSDTFTGSLVIDGSLYVTSDFFVDGSVTYINTSSLDVSDNIIYINTGLDESTTPPVTLVSGMKVNRGSEDPYFFIFSEADDTFRIGQETEPGLPGQTQAVATRQDAPVDNGISFWNDTEKRFDTSAGFSFNGTMLVANKIRVDEYHYMLNPENDGAWRWYVETDASGDLVYEKRIGGVWMESARFLGDLDSDVSSGGEEPATADWSGNNVGSNNNILTADGEGGLVPEYNLNFFRTTLTVSDTSITEDYNALKFTRSSGFQWGINAGDGIFSITDDFSTGKNILTYSFDGSAALFYDGSTMFETTSTGIRVRDEIQATTLRTSDSSIYIGPDSGGSIMIRPSGYNQSGNQTIFTDAGATINTSLTIMSGLDVGSNLSVIGSISGDTIFADYKKNANGGVTTAIDMDVTDTPDAGVEESYSFKVDGNIIAKVYAEADGTGGIQNEGFEVDSYQYMGDPNTNGSWRFYVTADASADLVFEKRVDGSWVEGTRIFV